MSVRWGNLLVTLLTWVLAGPIQGHAQRLIRIPPALPFTPPPAEYDIVNAFPRINFSFANDRIVGLAVPPGRTNELFITCQLGRILVITNLTSPTKQVFLDLSADTFSEGESGLVGLAFHPRYAENRQFYVYYTRRNRDEGLNYITLSRFLTDPANPSRALPGSELVLLSQNDRDAIHQAGDLQFGPDGYLYVPMGDEGSQNDPFLTSQHIDGNFFSGIFRIDVDGKPGSLEPNPHPAVRTGYRVPPDNPFIGATTFNGKPVNPAELRTEYWAVGLRNPHRIHFDRLTGELYAGDVGSTQREEINRIVKGGNYGWVHLEGTLTNTMSPIGPPPASANLLPPLYEYTRSSGDPNLRGQAVIGGLVYRGTNYPSLIGKYIFGDYVTKNIWAMTLDGTKPPPVEKVLTADFGPTGFGIHPGTGEILMAQRNGERVSRLILRSGEGRALPATLSETGVFANLATLTPQPGVEPYDVNTPFWSDYAIKRRWYFFQDATSLVHRDSQDRWTFPTGMVFMKHFDLELLRGNPTTRRRLETRFLVKTATSAYGITYRWRSDGSDADLVPDEGLDEDFLVEDGGEVKLQRWRYPSRTECMTCHDAAAGFALGFSTRQLNRDNTTGGSTVNQLIRMGNLGALEPPVANPETLPRMVAVNDSTAGLEKRFKSFLDANCAYCHMPGGIGLGSWDARFLTPLGQSGIINGPVTFNLGIPGARLIKPGDVNASILWQRIATLGNHHMPPIATSELYPDGISLVRRFTEDATYVVARNLFYNGSAFDGRDTAANAADDRAIAPNKEVLFSKSRASIANISSYSRGINGLMLDIWNLPGTPSPADFSIHIGNNNTPSSWILGPSPTAISVRSGAGTGGSDRVTLLWPDGAVARQWMSLSVLPSARTGLESAETFYIGSAPGDTGDQVTSAGVNAADLIRIRSNPRNLLNPSPLSSPFDLNRDRQVDSSDQTVIRMNETRGDSELRLIDLTSEP